MKSTLVCLFVATTRREYKLPLILFLLVFWNEADQQHIWLILSFSLLTYSFLCATKKKKNYQCNTVQHSNEKRERGRSRIKLDEQLEVGKKKKIVSKKQLKNSTTTKTLTNQTPAHVKTWEQQQETLLTTNQNFVHERLSLCGCVYASCCCCLLRRKKKEQRAEIRENYKRKRKIQDWNVFIFLWTLSFIVCPVWFDQDIMKRRNIFSFEGRIRHLGGSMRYLYAKDCS